MTEDQFLTDLLERLLEAAHAWSDPSIPSQTLKNSLVEVVDNVGGGIAEGRLYIDQYWAIYVHDGRSAIGLAPLIWFANPQDDPRGTHNLRYSDWRQLTKAEFNYWRRRNREALRNGTPLPMIVRWGGVTGVSGSYFFDNSVGMAGFLPIARNLLAQLYCEYLEDDLGNLLDNPTPDPIVAFI